MAGVVIHIKRCLIVGPSWVGDMVMAQSLFKRLFWRDGHSRVYVDTGILLDLLHILGLLSTKCLTVCHDK